MFVMFCCETWNEAVWAFTKSGDKVMIMTPVYPPFHAVVKDNGRELVCCPLIRDTEKDVTRRSNR